VISVIEVNASSWDNTERRGHSLPQVGKGPVTIPVGLVYAILEQHQVNCQALDMQAGGYAHAALGVLCSHP
jgi:hypothetical protein